MNSIQQEKLLRRVFRNTVSAVGLEYHESSNVFMEYTKTGQLHCHGYLITKSFKHFPIGVISDMAKACLNSLPKKYSRFYDRCINPEWIVYKDAPLKLKYHSVCSERTQEWLNYCNKLQ